MMNVYVDVFSKCFNIGIFQSLKHKIFKILHTDNFSNVMFVHNGFGGLDPV